MNEKTASQEFYARWKEKNAPTTLEKEMVRVGRKFDLVLDTMKMSNNVKFRKK